MEILCDQIKGVCLEICCVGHCLVLMGLSHELSHISLDPLGRKKKGTLASMAKVFHHIQLL
jgi:hypothetical protein